MTHVLTVSLKLLNTSECCKNVRNEKPGRTLPMDFAWRAAASASACEWINLVVGTKPIGKSDFALFTASSLKSQLH